MISCNVCKMSIGGVLEFFKDSKYIKAGMGAAGIYCMWMEGYNRETCAKIISEYGTAYTINAFSHVLTEAFICSTALPFCSAPPMATYKDWAKTYLADKPALITGNDFVDNLYTTVMSNPPSVYNILHLSDLNVDLNYMEGTNTECGDLVCCQVKHGSSGFNLAKRYGEARCDTPLIAVQEMFVDIK
jgi:hypothetical protein